MKIYLFLFCFFTGIALNCQQTPPAKVENSSARIKNLPHVIELKTILKKVEIPGTDMQVCDSSFYDFNNDQKLEGQLAYTQFNGKQVTLYTTMENVTKSLEKEGWTPDYRYQADGPTGTASGFAKGNLLCLVSESWNPAQDVPLSEDTPISMNDVPPEKQIISFSIHVLSYPQAK